MAYKGQLAIGKEVNQELAKWTVEEIVESAQFANAIGALVTTKKGAIPGMPLMREIEELLVRG